MCSNPAQDKIHYILHTLDDEQLHRFLLGQTVFQILQELTTPPP